MKYFVITRLHKDDLRGIFKDDPKKLKVIDKMEDYEMELLARKLADDYCNQLYWNSLKIIFEECFYEGK